MLGRMVQIVSRRGDGFSVYIAHPYSAKAPAVVLLSDLADLNPWIKKTADRFAENGYLACAPALYRHPRSRIVINKTKGARYLEALNTYSKLDQDIILEDIESVIDVIKSNLIYSGKLGIVGFSAGATFSFLTAARLDPDAAIAFYPTNIHEHLHEGKHISCQTILHMGKNDNYLTEEVSHKIHAALIGKFNVAIYQYQAHPGFANSEVPEVFNPEATELSFQRTFELLGSLK